MIKILNVSKYAVDYNYIVARYVAGDWWFYGAWNDYGEAMRVAMAEGGHVFDVDNVNLEIW